MTLILNRTYRCIWTDECGNDRISFTAVINTASKAYDLCIHLSERQIVSPGFNYRLQIWNPDSYSWSTYAPSSSSKYALFSED